ncbi:MAG TPA: PP0621 family protein [Acidiferrobacterales bacterium]|nr:PP0621 family protein [Acidiferrobacterales bacterium]
MGQLLRIFLILLALWLTIRLIQRYIKRRPFSRPQQTTPTRMLPCAQCGTYIPESDALVLRGKVYCCAGHLPPDS